jgi:hypothetical protein
MLARVALALAVVLVACGGEEDPVAAASGPGGSGGAGAAGGGGAGGSTGGGGSVPAFGCDALPDPRGEVVMASPADAGRLHDIVGSAAPGATVLLADGTYPLAASIQLGNDGVTVRGASGDAAAVVIDAQYAVNEAFAITGSNVTLTDLTITRAVDHLVHVYPPAAGVDVTGLHLYRVRFIDAGEQFVKVNPIGAELGYIDDGRVECSYFELTDAGRPNVESCCGGCYTGGIDAHEAWGWEVRQSTFVGIYCDGAGLAEHAIHFWKGSRDTLVENNTIVDCARGIGFGLGGGAGERIYPDAPHGGMQLAHFDGIARNNVIWADIPWFDTGIEIAEAREPLVAHNTVLAGDGATAFFSSIDYRFDTTVARIQNNLTRLVTQRDGAQGTVDHNLESTPLSLFVAAPDDFHLVPGASEAIDQGVALPEAGLDLDGDAHDAGTAPDVGADEL